MNIFNLINNIFLDKLNNIHIIIQIKIRIKENIIIKYNYWNKVNNKQIIMKMKMKMKINLLPINIIKIRIPQLKMMKNSKIKFQTNIYRKIKILTLNKNKFHINMNKIINLDTIKIFLIIISMIKKKYTIINPNNMMIKLIENNQKI